MPCNRYSKQSHKKLRPPIFIDDGDDAIADGDPNHGYGINFDFKRDSAVDTEVADILSKDAMVEKPIVEVI